MNRCVRSGFCCKQHPCPFGEWDDAGEQCKHLLEIGRLARNTPVYECGIYSEIIDQPGAEISPAFGAGCCSPLFNHNRARIIALTTQET